MGVGTASARKQTLEKERPNMSSLHFGNYLNELATVPLLTHQEEIQLGSRIFLVTQLRKLTKSAAFNPDSKEQDVAKLSEATEIPEPVVVKLLQEYYAGKENPELQAARETACQEGIIKLVGANLRLVVKCAGFYRFSHHDIEELTAEGNRGLMIAAEKYDPTVGTRFSTYATWWIQQSIRMAVNSSHTIRTPVRRASQLAKLMTSGAYDHDSEEQDIAKLSQETNISEEEVVKLLKCRTQLVPMDAPIPGGDGTATLQSAIPSSDESPDAQLLESERMRRLRELVQQMPEPKRQVLILRFGLDNQPVQTLEEIAAVLNVTRERIRKIQLEGVRILQEEFQKLGYNISTEALIDLKKPAKKGKSKSLSLVTRAKLSSAQKARWEQKRAEKAASQTPVTKEPQAEVSQAKAEAEPQSLPVGLPAQPQAESAPATISPETYKLFIETKRRFDASIQKLQESQVEQLPVQPTVQPTAQVEQLSAQPTEQGPVGAVQEEAKQETAKPVVATLKPKRFVSAETRAKISAIRRAQEEAKRAQRAKDNPAGQVQAPKNPMPLELKLRISAAMKASWARRRAEKAAADETQQLQNAA